MEYLHRVINNEHILWFAPSNQWIQMDEPQWFIFLLYKDGRSVEEAATSFTEAFKCTGAEAREVVENIYLSLDKLTHPDFELPDFSRDAEKAKTHRLNQPITRHYSCCGQSFSITYGSELLHQYIHQSFAHLLQPDGSGDSVSVFEVFPFEHRYALRIQDGGMQCFTTDEYPQLKRLLFVKLASWFNARKESDWTALLHASAVARNGKILLLSSASGSGKSTLAALLMQHGFTFFSDDFVPVEQDMVYPFPAALCIKDVSHWPTGVKTPFTRTEGKKAYVDPHWGNTMPAHLPAKAICFVNYTPGGGCELEQINTARALQLFHPESWVGDRMDTASAWLDWFCSLSFYRLKYDDNEAAIRAMQQIMDTP